MASTGIEIQRARIREQAYKLSDSGAPGHGLHVRVPPAVGKRKTMALGNPYRRVPVNFTPVRKRICHRGCTETRGVTLARKRMHEAWGGVAIFRDPDGNQPVFSEK